MVLFEGACVPFHGKVGVANGDEWDLVWNVRSRKVVLFPGGRNASVGIMETTLIEAELPRELEARARRFVEEGWAGGFDALLAEALRRFLESHPEPVTAAFIKQDVEWGLHGRE